MRHPILKSDACSVAKCRRAAEFKYLGVGVCRHHRELLAEKDAGKQTAALDEDGLMRVLGDVMEVTKR